MEGQQWPLQRGMCAISFHWLVQGTVCCFFTFLPSVERLKRDWLITEEVITGSGDVPWNPCCNSSRSINSDS
jgi:hypothetical protein